MQPATSSWWSTGKNAPKSSEFKLNPDVRSYKQDIVCIFRGGRPSFARPMVLTLVIGFALSFVTIPSERDATTILRWSMPSDSQVLGLLSHVCITTIGPLTLQPWACTG